MAGKLLALVLAQSFVLMTAGLAIGPFTAYRLMPQPHVVGRGYEHGKHIRLLAPEGDGARIESGALADRSFFEPVREERGLRQSDLDQAGLPAQYQIEWLCRLRLSPPSEDPVAA